MMEWFALENGIVCQSDGVEADACDARLTRRDVHYERRWTAKLWGLL